MHVWQGDVSDVELRIHGVSGTPPDSMLQHPHVRRVSGDRLAGFYRREFDTLSNAEQEDSDRTLLAYWWGGLTSGNWQRALWLLLLPFMLINVAFFMGPDPVPTSRESRRAARRAIRVVSERLQRLLALSLTLMMVAAFCFVGFDLVGWQCNVALGETKERSRCSLASWMGFLQWHWISTGGRLVVVALLPLGITVLLWHLGRTTWRITEAVPVPKHESGHPLAIPLGDRELWDGGARVGRLRTLHLNAALAAVGLFLTVPFLAGPTPQLSDLLDRGIWDSEVTRRATLTAALFLVLLACVVLGLLFPNFERNPKRGPRRFGPAPWQIVLTSVTLAALVATGVHAWAHLPNARTDAYPWLTEATQWLFQAQLILIVCLFVICAIQRHLNASADDPVNDQVKQAPAAAWKGYAQPMTASMAWLMGSALTVALVLRVAEILGTPETGSRTGDESRKVLIVPQYAFWASALATVVVCVSALISVTVWFTISWKVRHSLDLSVRTAYGREPPTDSAVDKRVRAVAWAWARGSVSDAVRRGLGTSVILMLTLALGAFTLFQLQPAWLMSDRNRWRDVLVGTGNVLMTALITGFLYVGWQAYKRDAFRRVVGIVWDVGTFWPRKTHPLAPPCYSERTVPDLIRWIEFQTRHVGPASGDQTGTGPKPPLTITMSAHSQGSVIAFATVATLLPTCSRKVALLTYGSPLARLYARFFPAYFGLPNLLAVGEHLRPDATTETILSLRAKAENRKLWPWINLYRTSDFIGAAIFDSSDYVAGAAAMVAAYDPAATSDERLSPLERVQNRRILLGSRGYEKGDVDWHLVDPAFDRANGDACYPPTLAHSDYWLDDSFLEARRLLRDLREIPANAVSTSELEAGNGVKPGQAGMTPGDLDRP